MQESSGDGCWGTGNPAAAQGRYQPQACGPGPDVAFAEKARTCRHRTRPGTSCRAAPSIPPSAEAASAVRRKEPSPPQWRREAVCGGRCACGRERRGCPAGPVEWSRSLRSWAPSRGSRSSASPGGGREGPDVAACCRAEQEPYRGGTAGGEDAASLLCIRLGCVLCPGFRWQRAGLGAGLGVTKVSRTSLLQL